MTTESLYNFIRKHKFAVLATVSAESIPELLKWFTKEYPKHCKTKLDIGKDCIRFKKIDQIPYDLIAELTRKITIEDWISISETTFKRS